MRAMPAMTIRCRGMGYGETVRDASEGSANHRLSDNGERG